jgi:hypothetical protein
MGTIEHHLWHIYRRPNPEMSVDLRRLFQYLPGEVLSAISDFGKVESGLNGNMSILHVVGELMARAIRSYVSDFGLDSLRASILKASGNKLVSLSSEEGTLSKVVSTALETTVIEPLTYDVQNEDGTSSQRIAALESGPLFDLGSPDLVFVFESANQLMVEKGDAVVQSSEISFPMFALHESDIVRSTGIAHLTDPIPSNLKTHLEKQTRFAHTTLRISHSSKPYESSREELSDPAADPVADIDSFEVNVRTNKIE